MALAEHYRQGKSSHTQKLCLFQWGHISSLSLMEGVQCNQTPAGWIVLPENGTIAGAPHWPPPLTGRSFSSSSSRQPPWEQVHAEPPSLPPWLLYMETEQTLDGVGKMLTDVHKPCHFVHLITEKLFSFCPLVSFHMGHKYLHTLYLFREVHSQTLL